MMTYQELLEQALQLESDELQAFVAELQAALVQLAESSPTPTLRQAGRAKGQILYVAADFDAPLADFEDYQ